MAIKCKNCANKTNYVLDSGRSVDFCKAGLWDREYDDQNWLHDDSDFEEYINKDQFCTDYIDL